MKRRDLQALCKRHGLPAGGSNAALAVRLADVVVHQGPAAAAAAEDEVVVPGRKGCLKPAGGGGNDAGETKRVSFVLEESRRRGRSKSNARGDSDPVDAEDSAHPVRRFRRGTRSSSGDVQAEEVGDPVDTKQRSKTEEQPAFTAQVGVSRRVTRRSISSSGSNFPSPDLAEAVAVPGSTAENSKSGRRRKAETCEPGVHDPAAEVDEAPVRIKRSRSAAADTAKAPIVIEDKRRRRAVEDVVELLPPVLEVPRNDAPVTRTLRNRSVQVTSSVAVEANVVQKKLEDKRRPGRPPTGRNQHPASSKVEEGPEKVPAPSKRLMLRRSGRHNSEASSVDSETIKSSIVPVEVSNGKGEDAVKQPTVIEPARRSTRKSVVSAMLEEDDNNLVAIRIPEAHIKRSRRKSVVLIKDSEDDVEEAQNAKGKDMAQQARANEPVSRSTRKSIIPAVLEEEGKSLIADKRPEQCVRKSKRKSVVSVKDSEGVGEETQTAKSKDVIKQPAVKEAVRRSTHGSVASDMLEDDGINLIAHKSPEAQVRTLKRKSIVPVKGGNGDGEETQNAKGEDMAKQQRTNEPVSRSTRKSIISAVLEEDGKKLIAEKSPEEHARRSKRKSVVPVKDSKGVGEETQNASGKDVAKQPALKEPVRRSTRRSVASAILEEEDKNLTARKSPEEQVRTLKRKSTILVKDSKGDGEETQNKSKSMTKQPRANEPVSRSTRKSITSAVLEEGVKYLIAEKSPVEHVIRSKRKSLVPFKDSKGVGEETQNAKGKDVVKQPAVIEPVRRATRRSVASAIFEEEDNNLIAHGRPEAQDRTLKRKSAVLVKDSNRDGEETQNGKGEDVVKQLAAKEPVRRSTRKSVASGVLEKEENDLIAAKKPEAHDRSVQKSIPPNMLNKEDQDQSKMVKKEGKGGDELKQQNVKGSVGLSRRSVATVVSEKYKIDSKETNHEKTTSDGRTAKRRTIVPEEAVYVEEAKCEDMVITEAICDAVIHGNESSSRGQEICQVNATGEEFSSGPLLVTLNEETSILQCRHKVIAGSESVDVQNPEICPSHGRENSDKSKQTQEYYDNQTDDGLLTETSIGELDRSSGITELLQHKGIVSEDKILRGIGENSSGDKSIQIVNASSDEVCLELLNTSFGRSTTGALIVDAEALPMVESPTVNADIEQSYAASESAPPISDSKHESHSVEQSIQAADLGKSLSNDIKRNPLSPNIHSDGADADRILPALGTAKGRSSDESHSSFGLDVLFAEEHKGSSSRNDIDTVVEDYGSKPSACVTLNLCMKSDCGMECENMQPLGYNADNALDVGQGVPQEASESAPPISDSKHESHSVEQSIQAADLGKSLSNDIKRNPLSPNIHSDGADADRILPALGTAKGRSSDESHSSFGLDVLFAEEHKGSSSRNDIDTVVEDYGSKPSACVTLNLCMKSDCGMECENMQPLGYNADNTLDVGQGVPQEASESAPPISDSKHESHSVEQSIQAADLGKSLSNDIKRNPLSPNIHSDGADADRILPALGTAKGRSSDESHSSFGLDVLFAEEHKGSSTRNDIDTVVEDYGSKPSACVTLNLCMKSDCGMECENMQPLGYNADNALDVGQGVPQEDNNDDEQAVKQGAVQECTIEKPSLCSAVPESKHECKLPEEADQSQLVLQSLFSQESIDSMECGAPAYGTSHTESGVDQLKHSHVICTVEKSTVPQPISHHETHLVSEIDSMECGAPACGTTHTESGVDQLRDSHVTCTVEKSTVSQPISHHDTHLVSEIEDSMYMSQQNNGIEGLPEISHEGELVSSSLSSFSMDANHRKELINSAELACNGEENRNIVCYEDLNASYEKSYVNVSVDSACGISGAVSSCLLHARGTDNDDVRLDSNLAQLESADIVDELIGSSCTEVQHPSKKEHCIENRENQVASRPCTNDIMEADTAKCIESRAVLLPDEGSEKDGYSKLKSTQAVESGCNSNKDISNTRDDRSVEGIVSERDPLGFTLQNDYPVDHYMRRDFVVDFSVEKSCKESDMSGGKHVSNAGTSGNLSFDSAVCEHKGAFSEEVVHRMENFVGTCPSNPKELLMELQSMSSKGHIKESDLDNLTLQISALEGDESTVIDKHVKVHSGSNLSQLESNVLVDESIQCSNTEVLHQGHNNQCNGYSTEEQVPSRSGTYDSTETATIKFTESEADLLPVEEKSGLQVEQLNSMLESAEVAELSPSCDNDVRDTLDNGSPGIVVYEKFMFGDKSDSRVNTVNIYAGTCSSSPKELIKELQSFSNETSEDLNPCDNLAFSETEREGDESTICHVESLVDTVVSSESDVYLGPSQDFSSDEGKQGCMSVSLHDNKEGFLKSNHLKDTSAYLSKETHNIERDVITEELPCEEENKRDPMWSSNCDVLHENSHSKRNGICQSSNWMDIDEINPCFDFEVLCQDHVEECREVNGDEVTPAVLEKDMSEDGPFERMECSKYLGGKGEEYNFSCDNNTGGTFCTGSVKNNMFELHEACHLDSCQKQVILDDFSEPKCPEESINCQDESLLGPGTCYTSGQNRTNESSSKQLISHIGALDQEQYNENNDPETASGLPASGTSETAGIERSVRVIDVVSAAVSSAFPDEQLKTKLESPEMQEHIEEDTSSLLDTESAGKSKASNLPKDS